MATENKKQEVKKVETNKESNALGNTNNAKALSVFKKKCRNAILTIQKSIKEEELQLIINYLQHYKAFLYLLITEHDGPQTPHYHAYVQYDNARTLDSRYLYGAHLEEALGSAEKCIAYLRAEDKKHIAANVKAKVIYEHGEVKTKKGLLIKDIMEMDDDEINNLDWKMWKVANDIKNKQKAKQAVNEWLKLNNKPKVVYITGDSGTGKTYLTKSKVIKQVEKHNYNVQIIEFTEGGFINIIGEREAEICVINEFRDSNVKFTTFLQILTNENINNVKGSYYYNPKLKKIYINSIISPLDIYKNIHYEKRYQIERRLDKIIKCVDGYKHITTSWEQLMKEQIGFSDEEDEVNLDDPILP